ncbi:MAG: MaoC family dehydratase N-terminal domain-containing protein [Pusillimonas sp.]
MRMQMQGYVYPVYRLSPDKELAAKMLRSMGATTDPDTVPPTYLIFLRGESHGVDLFKDLDIPRDRALHGGQRYEWFEPIDWDTTLEVTATVRSITEKTTKNGTLWFADVEYDYINADTKRLALRELTRVIKRG